MFTMILQHAATPRPLPLAWPKLIVVLSIAMAGGLVACSSVPAPQVANLPADAAFKEVALWHARRPANANAKVPDAPAQWWQLFNDPVLNDLQAEVAVSNETLKNNAAQIAIAQAALNTSQAALLPTLGSSVSVSRARTATISRNLGVSWPVAARRLPARWHRIRRSRYGRRP